MNIPGEFGLFPFQRFTVDELRYFFIWCAVYKVSDVDLTDGSSVSVSRFGRQVHCSSATLPTILMSFLIDELLGQEVIPRVPADNPIDRTIQINEDISGRYGLKRGERIRLRSHFIQDTSDAEEKTMSIATRVTPTEISDIPSTNIEPDLLGVVVCKSGLGFICGETGSGKSTLYSALYRCIMNDFPDAKIVAYKDPVEYILGNENDLLPSHRAEIGCDVASSAAGLCSVVRHNPETVDVGEIRGNETVNAAV